MLKLAAEELKDLNYIQVRFVIVCLYFAEFILQSDKDEKLSFSLSVSKYTLRRFFVLLVS